MAYRDTVIVAKGTWLELTQSDVERISVQVKMGEIELVANTGAQPANLAGSWRFRTPSGRLGLALDDIAPGQNAVRVWAYSRLSDAVVSVARPEYRTEDYAHIYADGVDDWLKATDAFSPGGRFVAVLAVKSDDAATSFSGLYADGASWPGQIRGISSSRWAVNAGSVLQPSL
jgi:hypothetical protein